MIWGYAIAQLELGLRWLNDRIEEDHKAEFAQTINDTFPNILNGIMTSVAYGLVLNAQHNLTAEFKGDRKLYKRACDLAKRRKNMP